MQVKEGGSHILERVSLLNDSALIKTFSYRTTRPAGISEFCCDLEENNNKKIFFKCLLESSPSSRH